MTKADEPAFARVASTQHGSMIGPQTGLTKREYFAAKAMQGIVGNHLMIDTDNWQWLSENAVKAADALIKELNKQQ